MSERKEFAPELSEHDSLRRRVVDGTLSTKDFLEEVWKIDQRTPGHVDAQKNIALLELPEVRALFDADEEEKDEFYNYLSLSNLHAGQSLGVEDPAARAFFDRAREAAQHIEDPSFDEWKSYLDAYSAYLDKDANTLNEIASKLSGDNLRVVKEMIEKL